MGHLSLVLPLVDFTSTVTLAVRFTTGPQSHCKCQLPSALILPLLRPTSGGRCEDIIKETAFGTFFIQAFLASLFCLSRSRICHLGEKLQFLNFIVM